MGPSEQKGFSLEGGECPYGLFSMLWYKVYISVPAWTNYLGLSFYFYHQISFKTINSGEGDIMVLYKVTVCVLILYISESFQFSVVGEIAT